MRKPAVAGTFYPAERDELRRVVSGFLERSRALSFKKKLKALIVPHAGYIYSGIVAGAGFKLVKDKTYNKVILLGPSHQAGFHGAAIATEDFETPLGTIKISEPKKFFKEDLIGALPEAHCLEHSLEVELPFLQEVLGEFELSALVLGEVNEKELAKHLINFIDEGTLIVASSDLSHYLPYDKAVLRDRETISNILHGNPKNLDACGRTPLKVLMHLAELKGWKPQLIDYRNSGDTAGDKSRVVGYAAMAYSD